MSTVSVVHCPVCPLIFEHPTEVEWHLRTDHRSHDEEEAQLRAELAGATAELDQARLRALQSASDQPAVTLILATTPAATMSGVDVARLRQLGNKARRRLRVDATAGSVAVVEERLSRAIATAEGQPTHQGLALLVSRHHLAMFQLPFQPRDRIVVDSTFATRDLEETVAHHPRYRVIVLGTAPRILEGRGKNLEEISLDDTVGGEQAKTRLHPGRRAPRPERWMTRRARIVAGCKRADNLLDRRADRAGLLPLVVLGDNRWLATFLEHSRHRAYVMGQVTGCRTRSPVAILAELAHPAVMAWRESEMATELEELRQADGQGRVAWGLTAAWQIVSEGSAEHLWVERSFVTPGRIIDDGTRIELNADAGGPGVV
ncbi:MAG: hypothetical protein ACRDYE_03100, partial [Acidimicrobiales bacterium]